ncbi:unnamed protein product [Dracunculus medinensis]|uniref:Protein-serine O-palmitoleoyltransferase porcupine n=1 Tax=Dracunculus medinensis TaxID=318479 RepID=A0A0N4UDG5_DRAME|nr:unnamed protein product [Dracunculus medinensis]
MNACFNQESQKLNPIYLMQFLIPAESFIAMRGTLMVILMKISSLSFDLDNSSLSSDKKIPYLSFLSYTIDPSSIVFGSWVSYTHFVDSLKLQTLKEELYDLLYGSLLISLSLIFVIYSSCVVNELFSGIFFWHQFGVAQSFRFSHYFICWLSAGVLRISGINTGFISEWYRIEWPRSLVDVVISWNIPMHNYLHKYVFVEAKRFGTSVAVFITYFISSFLHGINFQISAVLLSLGFYTFAEAKIRNRLSKRLNCCIGARKCRENCKHMYKEVRVLNYG